VVILGLFAIVIVSSVTACVLGLYVLAIQNRAYQRGFADGIDARYIPGELRCVR
jgi:hypothetical protein